MNNEIETNEIENERGKYVIPLHIFMIFLWLVDFVYRNVSQFCCVCACDTDWWPVHICSIFDGIIGVYLWLCDVWDLYYCCCDCFKINASDVNNNINEWRLFFSSSPSSSPFVAVVVVVVVVLLLFVQCQRNLSCAHKFFTLSVFVFNALFLG